MAKKPPQWSLLVLLVAVGLVATWIQDDGPGSTAGPEDTAPTQPCTDDGQGDCGPSDGAPPVEATILDPASACRDAGYLCGAYERTGQQHVLRWPDGTSQLSVHVPLPEDVDPQVARDLQDSAVRGIQLWQGRPFVLVVDNRPAAREATDIKFTWAFTGRTEGSTRFEWMDSRDPKYVVHSITLNVDLRGSGTPGPRDEVMLTAAHELGHALGLPDSDQALDIMYGRTTGVAPSTRDFRTLDALYRLQPMAWIKDGPMVFRGRLR